RPDADAPGGPVEPAQRDHEGADDDLDDGAADDADRRHLRNELQAAVPRHRDPRRVLGRPGADGAVGPGLVPVLQVEALGLSPAPPAPLSPVGQAARLPRLRMASEPLALRGRGEKTAARIPCQTPALIPKKNGSRTPLPGTIRWGPGAR